MPRHLLRQLSALPHIYLRLYFPWGDIDLSHVAAVHVEVPLDLVEDMTGQQFHGGETPTEVQDKAGAAMFHIHDTIAAALSARTDRRRWAPVFPPFRLIRVKDVWKHRGIGFTLEQHGLGVMKGLEVDIICPSELTPDGTMYCDVLPVKPPRFTNEWSGA